MTSFSTASLAAALIAGTAAVYGGMHLMPERVNLVAAPAGTPATRTVRVVSPEPAAVQNTLSLSGRTAPAEQALVQSRATGVVAERNADIGDQVKAGDVLLTIEAPEIAYELDRAKASAQQARARVDVAKLNTDRADQLTPKGFLSEQTRDERRATLQTAEADAAAAEAEVKRLEEVQRFQTVKAPFSGTVVSRQVERGDKVAGDQSQQGNFLYRIARIDELRVEIDVPQSLALKIKTGDKARVTFAELPGETFEAHVARMAGLIDQTSSTMRAELLMPNPDSRIPAGLNGRVNLDVARAQGTVTVPANTLAVRDGRQSVAVVERDNRIAFRPVTVGRDLGERVEVVSGLAVSDQVILSPNALLRVGDTVAIHTETATGGNAKTP